ncbi:MAG: hypothetical protein WBL35_11175 [Ornithinibacter sp.]
MDNGMLYIVWLVLGVVFGYICYRMATAKGHNGILLGVLGFFLPLIGIIAVLVVPKRDGAPAI